MNPVRAMASLQHRHSPKRAVLFWLLMLAVVFGQGLGVVHSISHGVPGVGGHAHSLAPAESLSPAPWRAFAMPEQHAHGPACEHGQAQGQGLQALFDHAPDEPACRLYDQLLQAGPLMPVANVLAAPPRARTVPAPDTRVPMAAPAAVYQARGPPRA
jgi:hypothetical protein